MSATEVHSPSLEPAAGTVDNNYMSQYTAPTLAIDAANGTTYAYRRFGRKGAIPVVFLQHFRGNLDNWDPALVDDIAAGREVILVDNSGVGLSTGSTPHSVKGLARDVLAFIDALASPKSTCSGSPSGVLSHRKSSCCARAWYAG